MAGTALRFLAVLLRRAGGDIEIRLEELQAVMPGTSVSLVRKPGSENLILSLRRPDLVVQTYAEQDRQDSHSERRAVAGTRINRELKTLPKAR